MFAKIIKNLSLKFLFLFSMFGMLSLGVQAGEFTFSPNSGSYIQNCEMGVQVMMDSKGVSAQGADAFINFNPAEVDVVQVNNGDIFDVYAGKQIDTGAGKVRITAFSLFPTNVAANGPKTFAVLKLKAKPGVTSTTLSYDFTLGNTTDSNIADPSSNDVLTSVGGALLTFTPGFCGSDTVPPVASNPSPAPGSKGNPLNSNITVNISDDKSGVELSSIVVSVDGEDYSQGVPGFSYTGTSANYAVTINPSSDFTQNVPVFVEVDARDIAGNVMNTYKWNFNQPVIDNVPPYVTNPTPSPGSKDNPLDSDVTIHVKDDLSGVNIDTVEVTVEGETYTKDDDEFSWSGEINDYFIVIDPQNDFIEGESVEVEVDAKDLSNNQMQTYSYSFNHPLVDSVPPYVAVPSPTPGSRAVPLNSNVSFDIRDNLSGVDLSTLRVRIDGELYVESDSEMNISGDKLDYAVVIDPVESFDEGVEVLVEIDAEDLRGNKMNTYRFRFNRPAVYGDGILEAEFGEECELPGTSGCSEECILLACEIPVEEDQPPVRVCGNKIVEPGEQCEPPGLGLCNSECLLIVAQNEEQANLLGGFIGAQSEDDLAGLGIERPEPEEDSDGDGLSDAMEELYGTSSGAIDSDGDGISDIEEILDYGTDPNVPDDFSKLMTKISNWKDGDITGSKILFVKGLGHAEKEVRVFAESVETQEIIFLGETVTGEDNKFALLSETELVDGDYLLTAESYESNGEKIDDSQPIKITVDLSRAIPAPRISTIDDIPVLKDTQVVIFNNQPLVFGVSPVPDSQVFVVFESTISTSTIISDSLSGFFSIFAPKPLETGVHHVTSYAVTPDGIVSEPVVIEFEIMEKGLLGENGGNLAVLIAILTAVGVISAGAYYMYRKRNLMKDDAKNKELFGESIVDKGVQEKKK